MKVKFIDLNEGTLDNRDAHETWFTPKNDPSTTYRIPTDFALRVLNNVAENQNFPEAYSDLKHLEENLRHGA